ncbi:MAG: magnesium chelatase subunit D [Geminicoccaceae bacterium]
MNGDPSSAEARWADATLGGTLFAIDPIGIGGIRLRGAPGPVRDAFLEGLRELFAVDAPWRRMPTSIDEERLLGGLDLAATLAQKRPVLETGLLPAANGGVLLAAMAERMTPTVTACLTRAIDRGDVRIERDGTTRTEGARFGVVALDEGQGADEAVPAALADRLGLFLFLDGIPATHAVWAAADPVDVVEAKALLGQVDPEPETLTPLCEAALKLGITSLRTPYQALRVARAHAAWSGRPRLDERDFAAAGRLVLAPRAVVLPEKEGDPPPQEPADQNRQDPANADIDRPAETGSLEDVVLEAVETALPADLLARMGADRFFGPRRAVAAAGSGARLVSRSGGRPIGVRRGFPRGGHRLNLLATLRSAAPMQEIRRRQAEGRPRRSGLEVRRDDFRVNRYKQKSETTTLFVVDASGSQALYRLGEAKGAVELLLAECYIRRDSVALISFRGTKADLVLPPTRSLVRAKRQLAMLAGGGATPLAIAIDRASSLAQDLSRRQQTPVVVLLTDGKPNIDRSGHAGRRQAEAHALEAAKAFRALRICALVVDTSPRPSPFAATLAQEMAAPYLALPRAKAAALVDAVRGESSAAVPGSSRPLRVREG